MTRPTLIARLLTVLCLLALLAGCAPAAAPAPMPTTTAVPATAAPTAAPKPPTATPESPLKLAVDKILQDLAKSGGFSGAAIVAQNGRVILSQGYGLADRARQTPNTPQTKIRLGELTQLFTALGVLILQERGKLSVQDSLCKYQTPCPDNWKAVTIENLLTSSSGIPDTGTFNQTPDQILASMAKWPLKFKPGTQYAYSHTGFIALGKVIEAASGQTYESFLQQSIFDPLKMASTGYDHGQADLAVGYTDSGTRPATLLDPQGLYAAGALYSTVEDLERLDQALFANQLVSSKTLDSMLAPRLPLTEPGWSSGYAFIIRTKGTRVAQDLSTNVGLAAFLDHYPDNNLSVIVLSNQQFDPASLADSVGTQLVGE